MAQWDYGMQFASLGHHHHPLLHLSAARRLTLPKMEMLAFNVDNGYLEGVVRGYMNGLLTAQQLQTLTQCETLEDLRMQLSATDYGNFLANEPSPLTTSVVLDRATRRMVTQFEYLRENAVYPLSKFLDFVTYAYMIDNVILLITGTLHERDTHELLERCHPLGWFDTLPALSVANTVDELYQTVLVETPLAPYFRDCLSAADLDDLNIEIIRNTLYKSYLEDFYEFSLSLGGVTTEAMQDLLAFEADRRVISITVNSFGTSLTKEERARLFPSIGKLYPAGNNALARADDVEQVKSVCDMVPEYKSFFDGPPGQEEAQLDHLEDKFSKEEVRINKILTIQQFNFSIFYAWTKLKEQEIRTLGWIAECIAQGARGAYILRRSGYIDVDPYPVHRPHWRLH